jgi:hypothetical protein
MYLECDGISIVYKVLVLKVSVGLVTIQGLIEEVLVTLGYLHLNDDSVFHRYDEHYDIQRLYCFLCLVEFVFMCVPFVLGFYPRIQPSNYHKPFKIKGENTTVSLLTFVTDVCFSCWKYPTESFLTIENDDDYKPLNSI